MGAHKALLEVKPPPSLTSITALQVVADVRSFVSLYKLLFLSTESMQVPSQMNA